MGYGEICIGYHIKDNKSEKVSLKKNEVNDVVGTFAVKLRRRNMSRNALMGSPVAILEMMVLAKQTYVLV